jgi:hypothetical protein
MVFKRLYKNSGSIFLAKALDELTSVNAVIVANETTDKPMTMRRVDRTAADVAAGFELTSPGRSNAKSKHAMGNE